MNLKNQPLIQRKSNTLTLSFELILSTHWKNSAFSNGRVICSLSAKIQIFLKWNLTWWRYFHRPIYQNEGSGEDYQHRRKERFIFPPLEIAGPPQPPFVQAVSGFNCVWWQRNAAGHVRSLSERKPSNSPPPPPSTPQTRKPRSWRRAESLSTFSLYFYPFVKHAHTQDNIFYVCTNKILSHAQNVNIVYLYIPLWPSGHFYTYF